MKDRRKSVKLRPDEEAGIAYQQYEPLDHHPEQGEVARYIASMAGELAALAGGAKMRMLTYFLNMARIEAEMQADEAANARAIEPGKKS